MSGFETEGNMTRCISAAYRPPVKFTGGLGVFGSEKPPDRLLPWHTASCASEQLFGEIQLNVGVVDRQGRTVTSLSRNDFVVYEDGVRQTIQSFEPTEAPFSLVATGRAAATALRPSSDADESALSAGRPALVSGATACKVKKVWVPLTAHFGSSLFGVGGPARGEAMPE